MTERPAAERGAAAAEERLSVSRREVEERLDALRFALRERMGTRIEKRAWAAPILAAAAGFAVALWLRGRGRRGGPSSGGY